MPVSIAPIHVLKNARIYTLDAQNSQVGALAYTCPSPQTATILATGSTDQILAEFGHTAIVEDIQGRVILPGLTDSHIHLQYYAESLTQLDCDTPTRAECLERVIERVRQTPASGWVRGHGWRGNRWSEGFGTAADLDAVSGDSPVVLTDASLHVAWVNSRALAIAGVNAETTSPGGGEIQRDEHGSPTGILFDAAMNLVLDAIPPLTLGQLAENIRNAQQHLWQFGLTGVHDFDGISCFQALQTLESREDLHLRVLKNLPVASLEDILGAGLRSGFGSPMLKIGHIKTFMDGALGSRTAAMLSSYETEPQNLGQLYLDQEELLDTALRARRGGLGMTVHAIGDRAVHETILAYEQLQNYEEQKNLSHLPHRIEHLQLVTPEDLILFSKLKLVASMQPIHALADMDAVDLLWGERGRNAYVFGDVSRKGIPYAFGSDAPVESPNPFIGIHAAVNRSRPGESRVWYPEQRLTLSQAIHGYTAGPAMVAGHGSLGGQLVPGAFPDLILLDQDPFQMDSYELYSLRPLATMVAGSWVHRDID